MSRLLVAMALLELTGPDHQVIQVNPSEIVAIRQPRSAEHFAAGTHCLIFTADGKYVSVVETCRRVDELLRGMAQ